MVAAWVTLFYCLFLYQGYQQLFRDSDAGWHIRNGEEILRTGRLPRSDPYSFTRAGQPWFAWEWASDVLTGAVHRAWGLGGVALFYGVVIAVGVWMWFRLQWALGGNFFVACALAPLLLSTESIHWLARPHTVSWVFLVGTVWYCERRSFFTAETLRTQREDDEKSLLTAETPRRRGKARKASKTGDAFGAGWTFFLGDWRTPRRGSALGWLEGLGVALVAAVWANLHASFFLGAAICLVYAVGRRDRALLVAGGIALLAPLANPYGYHLYSHVFRYLTDRELLGHIGEFQSFNFQAAGAWEIIAAVMVGMAGGALAVRRPERLVLAVLFTALALRSARALPIAALLLLPTANATITERLRRSDGGRVRAFLAYSDRLRVLDSRQNGWLLAPVVVLACFALLRAPAIRASTGFSPEQFPVAAYAHIPSGARLFAPDKFGGYLIYRSNGRFPVFFDGRSDLYGAEFLKQYGRAMEVRPGWRAWWDSFHFTHALVPSDSALIEALERTGWTTIFHDKTATLLAAGGT